MLEFFFDKVAGLRLATLLKETPTQVFSYEYCETFKNTYFGKHLRTAASYFLSKTSFYSSKFVFHIVADLSVNSSMKVLDICGNCLTRR